MWYPIENYKSQSWYRNTFLVKSFSHIAKVVSGSENKGWNNIYDSGCHFTCLAMIIGCDPASLASSCAAVKPDFFRPDPTQMGARLNDKKVNLFVWDMNKPHTVDRPVTIPRLWIPKRGFTDVTIALKEVHKMIKLPTVIEDIGDKRKQGLHIICGEAVHSMLVAGRNRKGYLLWEPDTSHLSLAETQNMIKNGLPFRRIWDGLDISAENRFQVLGYQVEWRPCKD